MLNFLIAAYALVGNAVFAQDHIPQLGFLRAYKGVQKQLAEHIIRLGVEENQQEFPIKTIKQKLDHFTPSNTETWNQRYAAEMSFYGGNNLVFLYIEGEGGMYPKLYKATLMFEQAKKLKAAAFSLEHRFYGESRPKPDLTLDSLKYLSSEQALADAAYFIRQMNIKHNFTNPKWIVFGCSYAGSLAAWLRYKYPELVYAAVSSSAPLFSKVDLPEYFETVSRSVATLEGSKCVDAIRDANRIMSDNIHNQTDRETYKELFNLCKPIDDDKNDIAAFFSMLAENFASIIQAHYNTSKLNKACEIMTNEDVKSPVHRYATWIKNRTHTPCRAHRYSEQVANLTNTSYNVLEWAARQWTYQTCTEFGWFQTSSKKNATFGDKFPVEYNMNLCQDAYDSRFDEAFINATTAETNFKYKGYSIPVSRVAFVHGSIDPWSEVGIKENPPNGSFAIFIKGTAHCADVLSSSDTDPLELRRAKEKIAELLQLWVKGEA